MLYFYLSDDSNDYLGHVSIQDAKWLIKMKVAEQYHLPLDDFELAIKQVEERYSQCKNRAIELRKVSGFESSSLNIYERILQTAKDRNCGLKAVSD